MISKLRDAFNLPLTRYSSSNSVSFDIAVPFKDDLDTQLFLKDKTQIDGSAKRIGIVFSGGPAPGGHDVLAGILANLREEDDLIGFLGGFGGLLQGRYFLIDPMDRAFLEGTAGFDYLGTDRTKVSTDDQFQTIKTLFEDLGLDAFIVVGGDDSNTNAAYLAQMLANTCQVIGIPKTIDGDLQMSPYLQATFGFHSATQHYSQLVKNLAIDALATGKYFHFVKLMGRNASHVTLEVAHQVQPHGCLLSEEVLDNAWGLLDVVDYFTDIVLQRVAAGKPYGVLIFPEGLAEVIPEIKAYLNGDSLPLHSFFNSMDQKKLMINSSDEDSHGNKNLSLLPLERILMDCVAANLLRKHQYKLLSLAHFFGYEGRSSEPSSFDSIYAKLLGKTAYELVLSGGHGLISGCDFSNDSVTPCGVPLTAMMCFDALKSRWLIKKTLVDLNDSDYLEYISQKKDWINSDPSFPRSDLLKCPKRFLN